MEPDANPAAPAAEAAAPAAPAADPAAPAAPVDPSAPKEVDSGPAPSLEQVHQANVHKLDNEPEEPTNSGEEELEAPAEPAEPEAPAEDLPAPPVTPPTAPTAPAEPTTPNLDITQNVEGKVAVRSFDGKTYYFNNVNELPEDFEFATSAEQLKAGQAFSDKAAVDNKAAEDAETTAQQTRNTEAVATINKQWNSTIDQMTKNGVLPTETAKLEEVKTKVFGYMQDKLNKGTVIDNFEEAYKAMRYDEMIAKQADDQKKLDEKKKSQGDMVQGGGAPEGTKPIFKEGPPRGVSLDQVHQRATTQLG